jgi:hypothetical protein
LETKKKMQGTTNIIKKVGIILESPSKYRD